MSEIKCPTEGCDSKEFSFKASINWIGAAPIDSQGMTDLIDLFADEGGPTIEEANPGFVNCSKCGLFFNTDQTEDPDSEDGSEL